MSKKITLKIDGIHCHSCKTLIETEVESMAGVNSAKVDVKTNLAQIVYDEAKTSPAEIIKAIEKLNYKVVDQST